ncbi:MAG: STAS domain-containing protein [Thioalkalivibrio sp.]|nr:MAG: STAS domain-containing protein [Thioalkalivibrio sp.]
MAEPSLVLDGAVLRLAGPVTLNTVAPLMARGRGLLAALPEAGTLDLSGVTRIDSAGAAMLVEFWRQRERSGASLGFAAIPEDLQPLLELYALEPVFGVAARH